MSFTVAAGDKITFDWPLADFEKGIYGLKVYGANGFYRHYTGDANDPKIEVQLRYQREGKNQTDGNAYLYIKRKGEGNELNISVVDHAYGRQPIRVTLAKTQQEIIVPAVLKASFGWYDFTLKVAGFTHYAQQFAGHVEHAKESFTDPLMGNALVR